MGSSTPRVRLGRVALLGALVAVALVVVCVFAFALALGGGSFDCAPGSGGGAGSGPAPPRTARHEIPLDRLRLYRAAGRRYDIDWTFLASIGAQECDHGMCRGDNGYGCAGPMQIAMRRGSPCSPSASEPTEWERWGVDANGDGTADVNDPADAIFGAARVLRFSKGAPRSGGSYDDYRAAACRYYGACSDGVADYADTVMRRAVSYGFRGSGAPAAASPDESADAGEGFGCSPGGGAPPIGGGDLGPVVRMRSPRRLAPLPASIIAPGFGPSISCDARIVPNVVTLMRRYRQRVTACQEAGHAATGEHPIGAGLDIVPADNADWSATMRLARAAGWRESCAASGVAPACARPPFRFVGYNGFPSHGDPAHCPAPSCPPHLHLSWNTSASPGGPESAPRSSYFAPSWIDVFGPKRETR